MIRVTFCLSSTASTRVLGEHIWTLNLLYMRCSLEKVWLTIYIVLFVTYYLSGNGGYATIFVKLLCII